MRSIGIKHKHVPEPISISLRIHVKSLNSVFMNLICDEIAYLFFFQLAMRKLPFTLINDSRAHRADDRALFNGKIVRQQRSGDTDAIFVHNLIFQANVQFTKSCTLHETLSFNVSMRPERTFSNVNGNNIIFVTNFIQFSADSDFRII